MSEIKSNDIDGQRSLNLPSAASKMPSDSIEFDGWRIKLIKASRILTIYLLEGRRMPEEADVITPADEVQTQLTKLNLSLDREISYRLETVFAKITGWGAKGEI